MKKIKKILLTLYLNVHFFAFSCEIEPHFIKSPLDPEKQVEYFVKYPPLPCQQNPLIILIHGHQSGPRLGGKVFFDDGTLDRYTQKGFIAVAISQPGYGNSHGPSDFCGPLSQAAVRGVIATFKEYPSVSSDEIFLYGISRGAIVASMVAAQGLSLRSVILDSGFYNLRAVTDQRTLSNIEKEAGLNEEAFHIRSAIDTISQIKSSAMIFHGCHGERAPVSEALAFYKGLLQAGVSAQLHLFDCGHHTPIEETRALIDVFLEKMIAKSKVLDEF